MPKEKEQLPPKADELPNRPKAHLIFVSHDSQDAELAEAFGKLISSVSAGVLKIFRSSDKKGTQGIEYGVEWYPKLMEKLESASDAVCLLTEHSVDRPWILYEAGVAKGKLNTPVYGVALGIPLSRANTGPFAQFQNCDDDEESLTKLVMQLIERIPGSEPDHDAVLMQVRLFKENVKKSLEKLSSKKGEKDTNKSERETSIPKLFEEIKVMFQDLPIRIERVVADRSIRTRRLRGRPMLLLNVIRSLEREPGDPVNILVLSSLFREEMPWVYEAGLEAYHATMARDPERTGPAIRQFLDMVRLATREPFVEELGMPPSEMDLVMHTVEQLASFHTRRTKRS